MNEWHKINKYLTWILFYYTYIGLYGVTLSWGLWIL